MNPPEEWTLLLPFRDTTSDGAHPLRVGVILDRRQPEPWAEHFDSVKRAQATAYRESIKPFLSQRQDLYGQATRVVADLALSKDPHVRQTSEDAFWKHYWSPLASVESCDSATNFAN
jgi:hypothetical protein